MPQTLPPSGRPQLAAALTLIPTQDQPSRTPKREAKKGVVWPTVLWGPAGRRVEGGRVPFLRLHLPTRPHSQNLTAPGQGRTAKMVEGLEGRPLLSTHNRASRGARSLLEGNVWRASGCRKQATGSPGELPTLGAPSPRRRSSCPQKAQSLMRRLPRKTLGRRLCSR